MRLRSSLLAALVIALATPPALAQTQPANPNRALLAIGHLASVVDLPFFFRLYRVRLPTAQRASYSGSSVMLYELSGASAIDIGDSAHPLAEGDGAFIAAGEAATIRASGSEPADLLVFLLTARPNQRRALLDYPAVVREVFRTPDPLPGLQAGPYEFSLTRVTFPAGMPANPAHYRSGAALDYVLAGTGSLTADGKTEAMAAETPLFESSGWIHAWANPGDMPFVLLQANINREGDPAVVPAAPK
jgi:quercetin dioxygenase-like cupin family protein